MHVSTGMYRNANIVIAMSGSGSAATTLRRIPHHHCPSYDCIRAARSLCSVSFGNYRGRPPLKFLARDRPQHQTMPSVSRSSRPLHCFPAFLPFPRSRSPRAHVASKVRVVVGRRTVFLARKKSKIGCAAILPLFNRQNRGRTQTSRRGGRRGRTAESVDDEQARRRGQRSLDDEENSAADAEESDEDDAGDEEGHRLESALRLANPHTTTPTR